MARQKIIVGNWKMHKTIRESTDFVEKLAALIGKTTCKVIIAPPFTSLAAAASASKGTHIEIAGQNMNEEREGALTGEISVLMLKDAGARYVILGHSERRQFFNESNEKIQKKIKSALDEKISPILCVGENEDQREKGEFEEILTWQLDECLEGIDPELFPHIMIAYEPLWAIGTGKTATPEVAQEAHHFIRKYIEKNWGSKIATQLPLLYGGSVKPDNLADLLKQIDINGVLVGGASLDAGTFASMVIQGSKQ